MAMMNGIPYKIWRALRFAVRGVFKTVEFIGALIYYLFTEIFVDPFIVLKPIKIAAKWIYGNCDRFLIVSLYFTYLVNPRHKHRVFVWLSERPWVVAIFPALIVAATTGIKLLALKLAASHPVLGATIFIGDKIALVPVALRMWDEVRPVVRRSFVLRQIDNVVYFLFHDLPKRAKDLVIDNVRRIKAFFAPVAAVVRERLRPVVEPVKAALRPLAARLKQMARRLRDWARGLWTGLFGGAHPAPHRPLRPAPHAASRARLLRAARRRAGKRRGRRGRRRRVRGEPRRSR